jgi:hypothetical protein
MRHMMLLLGVWSGVIVAQPIGAQDRVVVNGEQVTQEQYARELGRLGIPLTVTVQAGDYWYDKVSGLWGVRAGPALGQLPPDLDLGGELLADASGRGTEIFFNGRELHVTEVFYLQQLFGYALPGRYWLDAQGTGGVEGGPALFNLIAAAQAQSGGSGHNRSGLFGSTGSDGNCSYYMHPGGSSVMTGC